MANDIKFEAPTVALTSILTTTLNALANATTDLSAAIDNSSNLCTFMDLELTLASLDLSAQSNPSVAIYLVESVDGGSDYETGEDAQSADIEMPTADQLCAVFGLRKSDAAEAKLRVKSMIPIPPGHFKLLLRNNTGVAFAATGNTLAYRTYNMAIV